MLRVNFASRWTLYRVALLLPPGAAVYAWVSSLLAWPSYWLPDLFTHWLIPCGVVAACFAFRGTKVQRRLSGAAALLCAALMFPAFAAQSPLTAGLKPVPNTLKFAGANVLFSNTQHEAFLAWLQASKPDVVVVTEVSEEWVKVLEEVSDYPYRLISPQKGAFGIAVLSTRPLEQAEVIPLGEGFPPSIKTLVRDDAGSLWTVIGAHPLPPMRPLYHELRDAQLRALAGIAAVNAGPLVLLGDLNTTPWSGIWHDLRSNGLRPVVPPAPTWPAASWLPALIPIDHILANDQVGRVSSERGPYIGSDHRPVEAVLFAPSSTSR